MKDKKRIGKIAVCSAGTADIPVAEEAAQTAEYFGTNVERIYDVGVSGMHRLFSRLETIQSANCVIAVAGMEGALASVMGGLTGARSTEFCGLWCKYAWSFGTSYHDQFLCERDCCGEYR